MAADIAAIEYNDPISFFDIKITKLVCLGTTISRVPLADRVSRYLIIASGARPLADAAMELHVSPTDDLAQFIDGGLWRSVDVVHDLGDAGAAQRVHLKTDLLGIRDEFRILHRFIEGAA